MPAGHVERHPRVESDLWLVLCEASTNTITGTTKIIRTQKNAVVLDEAQALCVVPEAISRMFTDYTKDPRVIIERRHAVGDMIENLLAVLGPEGENPTPD